MIVEVLSASTESYDRGEKFMHYRRLESLREYVLVAQDKAIVERYTRQGDEWLLTELPVGSVVAACLDRLRRSIARDLRKNRIPFERHGQCLRSAPIPLRRLNVADQPQLVPGLDLNRLMALRGSARP